MTFSDETLMAYADGELDAAIRAEIERAVAGDPELAARIARHRSLRETLRSAYDAVLDEPVPQRLLSAVRAAPEGASTPAGSVRSNVVPLRGARARPPRRWTSREWAAIAASLVIGAVASRLAFRSADRSPLISSGGQLVASGALANALSQQLASRQSADAPVSIGVTFVAKSGDYCRTFTLRERGDLAGLACRSGARWQVEALARVEPASPVSGPYRQAASPIPPAILRTMDAEIAGDPLDAQSEAAARARDWKR